MKSDEHLPGDNVALADALSRDYLLNYRVCPIGWGADRRLRVAVTERTDPSALDDVSWVYRCDVSAEVITEAEIERLIERLATDAARERDSSVATIERELLADVRDLVNEPPVVRYVNLLIRDAYEAGASDVHFEATRDGLSARLRVDGVLVPATAPPAQYQHAVVSRIKLLAELDIAERRRPQDGRLRVRLEQRELDLRVSTVPTMHGESVVLRLLDRGGRPVSLAELGMGEALLTTMRSYAQRPHGLILVTGPTGSGKTTTLYACLQARERGREKIVTVEEPIEYFLDGVTQVPVQREAGVTFGSALRSILRQDPDVVMIGEMRDAETAEIAIQAAMTGHLVLSTLHTNDAVAAIPRLLDLGVPEYLLAATMEAVLAQRLVRRLCPDCREECELAAGELAAFGVRMHQTMPIWRARGCPACRGTGYRGRAGIFELLSVSYDIKEAIGRRASRADIARSAREQGMVGLRLDGLTKVREGITTIDEVLRVTQE